jgi:hypothetical protein
LLQRQVDGVFGTHQRRKVDFRRGRCLGIDDHVVLWQKPAHLDALGSVHDQDIDRRSSDGGSAL